MQNRGDKFFTVFCCLCLAFLLLSSTIAKPTNLIESSWQLEEETSGKQPFSAIELERHDEKVKRLEAQKKAEQKELERKRAVIKRKREKLLECMNEKGVKLYYRGENCKACEQQKAYFGTDFPKVDAVDCQKTRFECPFRGISAYPTWYLGKYLGIKKKGVKDLPTLARLVDCPW